jgi:hypothetical protein
MPSGVAAIYRDVAILMLFSFVCQILAIARFIAALSSGVIREFFAEMISSSADNASR